MKKILLLFVICLLMTGCSTEVTLVIDEDNISETIKIFRTKNELNSNATLKEEVQYKIALFESSHEYYGVDEFENETYIGKTYELSAKPEIWEDSSQLSRCYETFDLSKTDTNITLSTSDEYLCGYLFGANNVTLVIESDLELVSSNADKVEGNKLIWDVDSSNYENKSINFNYKIDDSKKIFAQNYVIYILLAIFGLGIIIYIFIKNKKNNEI